MHNLTRTKLFRVISRAVYPLALILIYPLSLLKRKSPYPIFFFFDRYCIGGSQSVFLNILHAVEAEHKQVYFTRVPADTGLQESFYAVPNAETRDINFWTCNIFFRFFAVHYYAFYINRHEHARVLGSNSTFFHDLVPFLSKRVHKIDLFHNFQKFGKKGFEFFGLANYRYLDTRVVVDSFTLSKIQNQYKEHKVPDEYFERVMMIEPAVEVPPVLKKDFSPPLKVLYAGRAGPQKRVWLLSKIAEHFIAAGLPVEFHFAGTMIEDLSETVKNNSVIYGEVNGYEKMQEVYSISHVVILTSRWEGFPMVVKEGMAFGCVPVVTALEGNKMHLTEGKNVLFIEAVEDEQEVVALGIKRIEELLLDPALLKRLSAEAYAYAERHFGMADFIRKYRKLLLA